jgi:hypothetical protein
MVFPTPAIVPLASRQFGGCTITRTPKNAGLAFDPGLKSRIIEEPLPSFRFGSVEIVVLLQPIIDWREPFKDLSSLLGLDFVHI